ncbi:phage tail protein [Pseudoalteromonas 'SMAR']|uniref:phage tail protein n=1 Tax=Pseudoalteromonas 'SMAR' TaxID=3416908 RepID=UPI003AF21F8D
MSKVVEVVGDVVEGVLDITGVGALFSGLMPDQTQPEQDVATLAKGLQKGIDQPRRITFGRDRVGGVIAHQATVTRGEKEFIQLIVLINGAPIDALEGVFIANKPLTEYPTGTYDYAVADGRHRRALQLAVQRMEGWTDKHIGYDQAHIYIELENNREVFPDGINDCEFLIRGARVWDPRDTSQDPDDRNTWTWSQNAVLCTLHYVRFYGANQVPASQLPMNWWIAAANVCDEEAEYTDSQGVTHKEPRYTVNGTFAFTSRPLEVLQQLERSFAGKVFRQMGQWYVRVGAWYGAPTYTVTMADVLGDVKIKWHADLRERANTVRAQFVDPKQNYERTDAPPVIAEPYLEQDAQPLEQTLSLPFVRSSATAQRLAAIQLEQTRLGGIELPLRHTGLSAAVGRTITVNIPEYHINNKIYRVIDRRFRLDRGVTIRCIEDGPGIWADGLVPGVEDLTPNTDYVPGQLKPVKTLSVSTREDGYLMLSWEYDAIEAVEHFSVVVYEVIEPDLEADPEAENEYIKVHSQRVNYIEAVLPPLKVGTYQASISAVNVLGKGSVPNAIVFNLDVPSTPSIDIETTENSATLVADIGDAVGVQAEWVWIGLLDEPSPQAAVRTPILTKNNLAPDTHYAAKCRAVTPKNKSAWAEVIVSTKEPKAPVEVVDLVFNLSQQATWTAMASNWLPPNLTNIVAIEAIDKISKQILSERLLKVHLEPNSGLISIEVDEQTQANSIELAIDGEGTNHLAITAMFDGVLSRQSFDAMGVSVDDINKIKENLDAVDAVAESILEQVIADNAALVANLQSRDEFNKKTRAIIARIDEDGSITQEQISLLQSSLANASATLQDLESRVTAEDAAISERISLLADEVVENQSQIKTVEQTLATETEAAALRMSDIESSVGNNSNKILSIEQTMVNEDAALSERISDLTAEVSDNKSQITTVEQALATETEASSLRMSTIESNVGNNSSKIVNIEQTNATQNEANAQRFSSIESSVGENSGKIETVEQTMVNEDAALSERISDLTAEVSDNKSQITTVEQALATETEASSLRMSTIESNVGNNSSKIVNIEQTNATQNEANAQRFSSIESSVGENTGKIETVEQTMASENAALSSRIEQLTSQVGDNFAHLQSYYYTAVDTDTAISASKFELQSQIDSNLAYLNNQFYTKSESDGAITSAITTLSTQIDGQVTAVNQRVNSAESDIYGNYLAINSLQQTAGNLDNGLSALNVRVGSVETTAEGNADAIQSLTSRVTNAENDTASAHLTLSAHTNQLGELEARAEIGVSQNGFITGMNVTPGKVRFKTNVFELYGENGKAVWFDLNESAFVFDGLGNFNQGLSSQFLNAFINIGRSGFIKQSGQVKLGVNSTFINVNDGYVGVRAKDITFDGSGFSGTRHVTFNAVKVLISDISSFQSNTTIRAHGGGGANYDFYAVNGAYGPFTGAHEVLLQSSAMPQPQVGDLIKNKSHLFNANVSNTMSFGEITSQDFDPAVIGVFVGKRELSIEQPAGLINLEEWYQLAYEYELATVNALGEGTMNVCGQGGDIKIGDLLCSSSMPGKAMKQPDNLVKNYTCAKAWQTVSFSTPNETAQIAVVYLGA